ncbi:MAG: ferredoxin:thioredoxin reductase [Candidatus Marinimicrobia bacterium]|jgi:ferredoxin-thioredoxin reductase catalytic subunit|nr:ferredoxin:thioredoxin reductase [Candidatus Neomarinimicrobiota bacterium]
MNTEQLYDTLRKLQEPKGYFFNKDRQQVDRLLNSLLINKERYGYMACPCRLAVGDRDWDRDIICPCVYRAPDVKEFGRCYCGLYVSADWNSGKIADQYVPERRPIEKILGPI